MPLSAVLYPNSKFDVGLTVPKSSLTLVNTATGYSTSQTVEGRWFRKRVTVNNGATVTFRNCWFYNADPADPWTAFRLDGGATAIVEDSEWGINEITTEDPDGWTIDHNVKNAILPTGGAELVLRRCYFHDMADFVQIALPVSLIEDCFMADLVPDHAGGHLDCIQFVGPASSSVIRRNWIQANLGANSTWTLAQMAAALGGINRPLFVKSDLGVVNNVTAENNFFDAEPDVVYYLTHVDKGTGFAAPTNVTFRHNTYSRNFITAAHLDSISSNASSRYGNVYVDDGSALPSQGGSPVADWSEPNA